MEKKIIAIVQARMGSTRLPGKVLKKVNNKTLIEILFKRLTLCEEIDKIVLATTKKSEDLVLANIIKSNGFDVYRGSENNVLSRFYNIAKKYKANHIIRITGDCPLIDPQLVKNIILQYMKSNVDYASNTEPPTYPDGLDVEIFSFKSLLFAHKNVRSSFDKEHVTTFLKNYKNIKRINISNDKDLSSERWTVDEPEDFEFVKKILNYFHPKLDFAWKEVLGLKSKNPEFFLYNSKIKRNEGSVKGKGQKLYVRAKKIIPGGTMLLSKRPEMFLPDIWPSYFSKAKKCKVWDLDDNEFLDMASMGIGTNTLGYGHPEVDDAVRKVIDKGNLSTLNCSEEVFLVEKLTELHPWADMGRLARTGGEANAIAVRIARAFSKKDNIAICGYHGWHDWYLSSNLGDNSSLDGHLLPGLKPKGIPRKLKDTTFSFNYNDIESLEKIIHKKEIGIIKMEVSRSNPPEKGYLESVRELATQNEIILIFDECTSGFRETFGGLHKKYNVNPDIMILGKTLGNGYAITAVIGKGTIMEECQNTFISSTFWTERIGPSAAIKTLEVMGRIKSWEIISDIGKNIVRKWTDLFSKYNLDFRISGLPSLSSFQINSKNWLAYKTYITQEMLKRGILASNLIYVSTAHKKKYIDKYFHNLEPVIKKISDFENGDDVYKYLEAPVCHDGFKRLN